MTSAQTLQQAQSLAAGLQTLILAAERLAFVAAPGLHGRRRGGPGDSFWQFRDWQNGDDARRIDWRRSAQGDRLFFREREWEAQANLTLRLEDTPTLTYRSDPLLPTKRDRAALLLLALAAILLRAGERVALGGVTPPLSGNHALPRLASALITPTAAPLDEKSRRVTFGDCLVPPTFAGQRGGAVLHLLDPAECDFSFRGRIRFEGFADEPAQEAAQAEAWAAPYKARMAAHREAVARAATQAGQTYIFHRTDHPPAHALAALYQALRQT